jgi:hypothetical protein
MGILVRGLIGFICRRYALDGIVGCDAVEALGWLLSELGDLGASAAAVSAQCRRRALD